MSHRTQSDQNGFVSIIVAAMIMVILALLTIGFTRIMQREQRQTIDRQLSRQALYAAESGINDTYDAIVNGVFTSEEKTTCDPTVALNDGIIDGVGDVSYSCVQYDTTPTEILYELSPQESEIARLVTKGDNFNSISIEWGISSGDNNLAGLPSCTAASASELPPSRPNTVPVLRIDLTNISTLNRASLTQNSEYIYALPCNGTVSSTTHNFSTASRGDLVLVSCSGQTSRPCSLVIDGLGASSYISRLKSVYTGANISITGREGASNDIAEFVGLQTIIDVTARSNDVVRRLRASIPFSETTLVPEAVLHSFNGVCKQLDVNFDTAPQRARSSCP